MFSYDEFSLDILMYQDCYPIRTRSFWVTGVGGSVTGDTSNTSVSGPRSLLSLLMGRSDPSFLGTGCR